jgi:site-specific DNA-methyltransferase (adenine-specific)
MLYNEDCLKFMKTLEDNSIQFIMADPPYLISEENTSKYKLLNEEWDKGEEIIYDCIKEFKRILKRGGSLIIWYDVWKISYLKECLEENKFKQIRLVEWLKKNSPPIASNNSYLPNSKEYFVYGAKNTSYLKQWFKAPFNASYDKGVYEYSISGKNRIHPTEKPYKLMEEIILKHTNENDIVYIPFAGSGVDIEVCIKNNRQWIATEISKEYCDNIEKRIENI